MISFKASYKYHKCMFKFTLLASTMIQGNFSTLQGQSKE